MVLHYRNRYDKGRILFTLLQLSTKLGKLQEIYIQTFKRW